MKQRTLNESLAASSSSTMDGSRKPRVMRSLSFDLVEIRYHRLMPDRPDANVSPDNRVPVALTLSWKSAESEVMTVQEFECNRPRRGSKRPTPLNAQERVAKLMHAGYNLEEICQAQEPAKKTSRDAPSKRGVARSKSEGDKGGKNNGKAQEHAKRTSRDVPSKRGVLRSSSEGDKGGKNNGKATLMAFMKQATKKMVGADSATSSLAKAA